MKPVLSEQTTTWRQLATDGRTAHYPHEYVRGDGETVDLVSSCDRSITGQRRHAHPQYGVASLVASEELTAIIAALPPLAAEPIGSLETLAGGLSVRFTLPRGVPPLRMLLIFDNLAGHKTAAFVCG